MKILQFSCRETRAVDMRQADAVLRHRPTAIIFEAPAPGDSSALPYNSHLPLRKPLKRVREHQRMLRRVARTYPWVASDIHVYNNIMALWAEGHNVKLYVVDGPRNLLMADDGVSRRDSPRPCRRGTHLMWWVRIYLREKIMTRHVRDIFKKHNRSEDVVLVFLQKFHWRNVQYQLSHPSRKDIWRFYFGSFKSLDARILSKLVRSHDRTLYTYWKKYSGFG